MIKIMMHGKRVGVNLTSINFFKTNFNQTLPTIAPDRLLHSRVGSTVLKVKEVCTLYNYCTEEKNALLILEKRENGHAK